MEANSIDEAKEIANQRSAEIASWWEHNYDEAWIVEEVDGEVNITSIENE